MDLKKIFLVITFLVVSIGIFGMKASIAKAITIEELLAQIAKLRAQIAQLQQQLAELQGKPAVWCHDFNVNLKIGDTGDEVYALQTALEKEGLFPPPGGIARAETQIPTFGEYTASAVVAFQEKYKDEILTPLKLTRGTGFVGKTTRAKLNKLYGCGVKPVLQKCADGTPYGQCSINKPKYCENGNLIDKCSLCGCTSGTICQKDICLKEKTYVEGIVLVNKKSKLTTFAKKLAEERKWYLLEVSSSNPYDIREEIIKVTNDNKVDYLLILGDDSEIPITNHDLLKQFLEKENVLRSPLGYYDANNVLDSIYYGNIDNDSFIELAVGRLPFNDPEIIESYFLNLNRNKDINNVTILRPPSPILGVLTEFIIKKSFLNYKVDHFITESLNANQISNYLKESDLFLIASHGAPDSFVFKDGIYHWLDLPDLSAHKPIFIASACNTAKEFGKEFIKKGGTAFIGYYTEAQPNENVFPIRPVNKGDSIGKSIKNIINKNIATIKWEKTGYFPMIYYLIGDPSIKINYPELNDMPKLNLELKKDKIIINIPPYEKELTSDGELRFFIDGNGSQLGSYYLYLPLDLYNTLMKQGYFFVDDPEFVKYALGALILIECNPNKPSQKYQCFDTSATVYDFKRFNIKVPYKYAATGGAGGQYFVFEIDKTYTIFNFYLEVEGQRHNLSRFSNYGIISGNEENFLLVDLAENDILNLLMDGGLFKEKRIILTLK
jgi:hypothetical protein